jgi:putative chitinase
MISLAQLSAITGHNADILSKFYPALIETTTKYQITTNLRLAHFLAQILWESGNFKYLHEIASGEAYENRKDLGNTVPGYGVKYKGRGVIQLTGYYNYAALTKDFGHDFVSHPEDLEQPYWAIWSAGWYWNSRNLNAYADIDDLITLTRKINGGLNGFNGRMDWLKKCKEVLGI